MDIDQWKLRGCVRVCIVAALMLGVEWLGFAQSQNSAVRPDRGVRPNGTYSISDIENISLTNGNLNLSIPLAQLPPVAGGKLSWTVRAIYNSKIWDVKKEETTTSGFPAARYVKDVIQQSNNGGWRIGGAYQILFQPLTSYDFGWLGPQLQDPDYDFFIQFPHSDWVKVQLITPDGATHELQPLGHSPYQQSTRDFLRGYYWETPDKLGMPLTYYSSDGSFIWARLYPSSNPLRWEAYMPDGTRVFVKNGFQRVEDTNGNR